VSEAVFDFIPDSQRQWVLLGCKGYCFLDRKKLVTQVLEPQEPINGRYLMYPVVARKEETREKLHEKEARTLKKCYTSVGTAAFKPQISKTSPASQKSSAQFAVKSSLPTHIPPSIEYQILSRDVSCYDRLIGNSRLHKETQQASIDLVGKHGDVEMWKPAVHKAYKSLHDNGEITDYFVERMGFEQHFAIVNSLLRVLKGDFNFYYKDTLVKIHRKFCIPKSHYAIFMMHLEAELMDTAIPRCEIAIALKRFRAFEMLICCGSSSRF
jgi:hypothetical protein